MKSVAIIVLFLLGFQQEVEVTKLDSNLFDKINAIRIENKCAVLIRDKNLDQAAENQAKYIANKEVLDHVQKENSRTKELVDRVKVFGSNKYVLVAENLLFTSVPKNPIDYAVLTEKMKSLWENSPSHLKNIKNSEYNYTGFGFALNKSKTKIYVVQVFGKK
ncbi:CAP domain-containing protein [Flavobacterium urocaniciphilum]|uniref:Cysteine-rich secretory protein family protein n=1 Tax=Flavobacterium urocaniciphilum TaxID=1299341 RepID=A0A1H9E7N4_9FLAO|nr:CAP domain-containing protein [Flavobacterium urocaniciphilum]SEQ21647.1 Cysteine-rich secretory protein family protein [Flavobacterium urocaniciphilum]